MDRDSIRSARENESPFLLLIERAVLKKSGECDDPFLRFKEANGESCLKVVTAEDGPCEGCYLSAAGFSYAH